VRAVGDVPVHAVRRRGADAVVEMDFGEALRRGDGGRRAGRDKSGVGDGLVLSVSIPRLLALPSRRVERWKTRQTQERASRTGPHSEPPWICV